MILRITAVAALALALGCAPKQAPRTRPDLFAEICRIEATRHGDQAKNEIANYGNAAMDQYLAAPGPPRKLWNRYREAAGVCRGALLQLLLTAHPAWARDNWDRLAATFAEREKLQALTQFALRKDPFFEAQTLHFAEHDQSPAVRAQAASALAHLDLSGRTEDLRRILANEAEADVLTSLIYSLNAQPDPAVLDLLDELYDHPSEAVQRAALTCWSTSELADKEARIRRYLRHESAAVRVYAQTLLTSLAGRDKLDVSVEVATVERAAEKDVDEALQQSLADAIERGSAGEVEGYLSVGADPDHPFADDYGNYPLHLAVEWKPSLDVARLLLDRGVKVDRRNRGGRTPLMDAALGVSDEHPAIMEMLVARGADLEARDNNEETALILAARNGRAAAVRKLLALGADPTATNMHGHTALSLAELLAHDAAAALLREALGKAVENDRP